jgi:hypothetical protein
MIVRALRALVALTMLTAVGVACGQLGPEASGSDGPRAGWVKVPSSPLSPRFGSHAFWVGEEIVVLGGSASDPCPPGADCVTPSEPPLRDGAALDPATQTWRPIAPAPVPLGWASGAVLDDTLYLWVPALEGIPGTREAFLAYDVGSDQWEELPLPPTRDDRSYVIAPAGDRVVAYQSSQEWGFDRTGRSIPRRERGRSFPPIP